MSKTKLDWALEIAQHGLPVFPLHYTLSNGDCSCTEGEFCKSKGKHPLTQHGYKEATRDEAQIKSWWAKNPKANIAIHPGVDYVYMDLDIKDPAKNGYESLSKFLNVSVEQLKQMTYSVETASGGMHMYFSVDSPQSNRAGVLPGVDVRGQGGHVVAPGSTIFKQDEFEEFYEASYKALNDLEVMPVPEAISTLLRASREKTENAQASLVEGAQDHPAAIERMRELLKARKPAIEGDGGDDHTIVTIYQCRDHDISAEVAMELLTEEGGWNDRCVPPWDIDKLKIKIENAYKYAKSAPGNKGGAMLEMALESGGVEAWSELPKDLFDSTGSVIELVASKSKFAGHLFNANDFMNLELDYNFVIDGWVPDQGYTAMLAKRGGGKTTAIMDMVCHVACDMDWWGTSVEKGYTVVYISGEDTPGVKARLQAWCMKHLGSERMADPNRFMIFDMTINLVSIEEVEAYYLFIKEQTKLKEKVLFVVDTWQRMTALSEGQSDEKDMQKAILNLESLCRAFKGPSIIAVHPPKANSAVISGSGVIENNSQAIIHITEAKADIRDIITGRVKGAPEGLVKKMKIVSQPISGFTKRGRRLTGALFEFHGGTVGESRDMESSTNELKLLELTMDMLPQLGTYYPQFPARLPHIGDIAKLVYDIFETKGEGDLGQRWLKTLKEIGFTEYEVLGVDGRGFKTASSPVYQMLNALRERNNNEVDTKKDGYWLVFTKGKGKGFTIAIDKRKALEEHITDDDGDDF